jgi:cytochrome c-type biogenesis protein CcmH
MLTRRGFFGAVAAGAVAAARAGAQQATPSMPTMSGPMDQEAYKSVAKPPKSGASPSMSVDGRDALEHRIHCQCGCTLDVYTCRTTDFTCSVSPAMHRDVMELVAGGYSADEIIAAFQTAYGDKVLMAPPKVGFNWAGYLTPFAALATGAVVLAVLIGRWRQPAAPAAVGAHSGSSGTADELRRLEELVRRDDEA